MVEEFETFGDSKGYECDSCFVLDLILSNINEALPGEIQLGKLSVAVNCYRTSRTEQDYSQSTAFSNDLLSSHESVW
jgi:hypothetical protein